MATQKKRVHPKKWPGVYYYETANLFRGVPDRCFYINYRQGTRLVWEKVGKLSEGYSPDVAAELRAERVKSIRHGEEVKTAKEIRQEKEERDKTFGEIAAKYFEVKGPFLKGYVTDKNRYEKHLSSMLDKLRVSEIKPHHVEEIRTKYASYKPATVWNILEMMRRIINYGYKTNRCPALSFQIEMPVKDNERIEHLSTEEAQRFLDTARTWPARDVGNMLMLAFFTGMRRGEIFKLEDRDVDFELKLIRLRNPKGKKSMFIGLSKVAEDILRDEIKWRDEHHPDNPFIFPGRTGGMRTDCSAVDRFRVAAGLPKGFRPFHGLRHHFAVSLANSGKFSMDIISEMLTHKNADFTKKIYAQFLPETLSVASNVAADILLGNLEK